MRCICQNVRITQKQIDRILNGDEVNIKIGMTGGCILTLCLKGGKP